MIDYPSPVTKQCHEKISEQVNNSFFGFLEKERESELLFFCYIKYKNKKFPVLVTTYEILNDIYKNKHDKINITLNNKMKNIEFGEIKFKNYEYNLSVVEVKEKKDDKINFLELDDILYREESEICLNGESIYIINYNFDNTKIYYGIIKNNVNSKINYFGNKNINNKLSLIFNLSNNKLIGIYKNSSKRYNKGILFNLLISQFVYEYEHQNDSKINKLLNEINIIIEVSKEDINKNIYFLSNYNYLKLSEKNTKLYIDNNEIEYNKYFIPESEGEHIIDLQFFDNITDCSYMFAGCKNIKYINFIRFNTINVKSMKFMFYKCSMLQNINLLSFDTKNVTDMSFMFKRCYKLRKLDLSSFNTKNVIKMVSMFSYCDKLQDIDISNFDLENVLDKGHIFNEYNNVRVESNNSNHKYESYYLNNLIQKINKKKINEKEKKKLVLKLLVVGKDRIGKTPLILRYISGYFSEKYIITYGQEKYLKDLEINKHDIRVIIIELEGNRRFYQLFDKINKIVDGYLVGFDLTNPQSIDTTKDFIEEIEINENTNFPLNIVLFGNKCDDLYNIKIDEDNINKFKEEYKFPYFSTSAKDGTNIKEVFDYLIKKVLKNKNLLKEIDLPEDIPFELIDIRDRIDKEIESKKK